VIVSDRGADAPPGQRYAVLGFDPDTTERYWRSRPKGERKRLVKAAAKKHGVTVEQAAVEGEDILRRSAFPLTVRQPEPETDNRIRIDRDTRIFDGTSRIHPILRTRR
jgi:hypothetical protein